MLSPIKTKTALTIFSFFLFASFIHPFRFEPHTSYFHEILTILGLLIVLSYVATAENPRLVFPKLLFFPVAIIVVIVIQLLLKISLWPEDFLIPILYFMLVGLAFVIGASLASQAQGAQDICQALAVAYVSAALLSVVMQMIQVAHINAMPFVMPIASGAQPFLRPYANVGQPNQLALLQCLAMASVWWLYQRRAFGVIASVSAIVFLIAGLALTQSRIGWIIAPIFAGLCVRRVEGEKPVSGVLILLFVTGYIAFVFSLPYVGEIFGFSTGSVERHIGGRSERWVLIQQAWHMALNHPWLGVGWFGFGGEQARIASAFSAATYSEHSHNLILNFAAELGLPLTIIIFFGLSWWFIQCCLLPKATVISRFSNLALIALFVHSMVEFPLWYSYFLIPASLLMGAAHQLRWPSRGILLKPYIIFAVFLVSSSILVAITLSYQKVTLAHDTMHLRGLGYQVDMVLTEKPAFTFFPQLYDELTLAKSTVSDRMSADEIAFAERVSQRFANDHLLNKMANIYALNGRPQQSAQAMLTLQRLHPFLYAKYYDDWKAVAINDARFAVVLQSIPKPDVQ